MSRMTYRLWVNDAGTVLVRLWPDGKMEVAVRKTADDIWGQPVEVVEERVMH